MRPWITTWHVMRQVKTLKVSHSGAITVRRRHSETQASRCRDSMLSLLYIAAYPWQDTQCLIYVGWDIKV